MAELNDDDLRCLRETYGSVKALERGLADHLEWSKVMSGKRDEEMKKLNDRMEPLEELHGDIKRAVRVSTWIGLPMIAGLGALGWEGLKAGVKKAIGLDH